MEFITDTLDDSLILALKNGARVTSKERAFSVSALKQYREDPMRYFIQRIQGVREPQTVPLVFGSATHAGFEAFYGADKRRAKAALKDFEAYLRANWDEIPAPTERYNDKTPHFANSKKDFPVTVEEMLEKGRRMLAPFLLMLDHGWEDYTPTRLMKAITEMTGESCGIERRVGDVARERGMPYAEMDHWCYKSGGMVENMNVAVVAGLPVHGYIDLIMDWEDGTPTIIDHKGVSHVVSFYGPSRSFSPSYNPANDLQLDVYCSATNITRAGFQFVTKLPQYVPDSGILYEQWIDERAWKALPDAGFKLPMALTPGPDGEHHYIMVWRPAPQDHPTAPSIYTPENLLPRVFNDLRPIAEQITISCLLFESGVPPEIAFPAGNPDEIAAKSCPFCFFNEQGLCKTPRTKSAASERSYKEAWAKRYALMQQHPEIQERIQLWQDYHRRFFDA